MCGVWNGLLTLIILRHLSESSGFILLLNILSPIDILMIGILKTYTEFQETSVFPKSRVTNYMNELMKTVTKY